MRSLPLSWSALWLFLGRAGFAAAATYEVGPGQAYTSIGAVPWESLQPGDLVLIHARPQPYQEKWVVALPGTEAQPIVIRGVPDANGALPVIDGRDATTRSQLNFWNEERGVIKIGGANTPSAESGSWITIENLDIRSARPPNSFTGRNGLSNYNDNAASIFVEDGQDVVIRNCVIHDSGNGIFVAAASRNVTVEGCSIYDNGNEASIYEHNTYTEALGMVYQYNHFGPLRAGCDGNNLKDRSAGLVVRYNWIEGGNRQLDLVDAEGNSELVNDPSYHTTLVYGNVLVEPDGAGNSQIVHYGGDSGTTGDYRKGTLYFFHNTVVSTRTGNTTLFRLSTNEEICDCRNNTVYVTAPGSSLAMLNAEGTLHLRANWFKTGWVDSHSGLTGQIYDDGGMITGASPTFVDEGGQDFHLAAGSACIDAGAALDPAVLPDHDVPRQYVKHQASEPRPRDAALDIGAFEAGVPDDVPPMPPTNLQITSP